MDEARFVASLRRRFPFPGGVGIGDDTSVIPRGGGGYTLVTTDLLVEGVDFVTDWYPPGLLARRALAVNLSDIAAMGGIPEHAYLALGWPVRLGDVALDRFFSGLSAACRRWKVLLAGGDYSRSEQLVISFTVTGRCDRPVLRSGARPGDRVAVTGFLGDSALGLALLMRGQRRGARVDRHRRVEPALAAGLAAARHATAMIDVSDGFSLDLSRICKASGVGAEIEGESLPVRPSLRTTSRQLGLDAERLVLGGGEDFVLIITYPPEEEAALLAAGIDLFPVGRITARKGLRLRCGGKVRPIEPSGYDHFGLPAPFQRKP